ncbi:hypothetical protein BS47DRAFT_1483537 [Hydnum rufescens UP504]|uniref:Uncharacterized protein n=1 Tax=Hydnum rufescens UP504 TaxID=1448309 RepID=A0A9P6B3N5_9AGAM|nr:hypothetical protein BS47DRAFT_1483537 [Hydnum rufescens UP504]
MDEYSSLFTSGLRAVASAFGRPSASSRSSGSTPVNSLPRGHVFPLSRHLQPPQNPHLAFSPSRRQFAQPSPRRKHRSSFSANVSSPLAGIKTPVRAVEVAARMSSMVLSPSKSQNRAAKQHLPLSNEMTGAPIKPKPAMRARRLPPARKPPPTIPLPSLPGTLSSSPSHLSNSPRILPIRSGSSLPSHLLPPTQPPFSPKSIPGFAVTPATPPQNGRGFLVVDDVFGSPAPYRASKEKCVETDSDMGGVEDIMDDTPRLDSSPMHGALFSA